MPYRTKPGVRPLSRKRDKPLRTYGRQPTATPEPRSEPHAKRARTVHTVLDERNIKLLGITIPEDAPTTVTPIFKATHQTFANEGCENQPLSNAEPNVPAKRSILNYFKPVSSHLKEIKPTVVNIFPDVEVAEEKEARPLRRPARRLLRVRSNEPTDVEKKADPVQEEKYNISEGAQQEPRLLRKRTLGGGSGGSSPAAPSRRVRRKPISTEVQTTLNISNQAPFSECKVCDTVWNPLYPDDVKYHTKRHATHVRGGKKRQNAL